MPSRQHCVAPSESPQGEGHEDYNDSESYANHPRVLAAKRKTEPDVAFRYVPHLAPRTYRAYCRSAKIYRDRAFQRWVAAVQFDVLADNSEEVLGRLTWFLNLGSKDRPNASRRSLYWAAWVHANGGVPQRRDRLSPRVFCGRMAVVEIGDTKKDVKQNPVTGDGAYSVVRGVTEWLTGFGSGRSRSSERHEL